MNREKAFISADDASMYRYPHQNLSTVDMEGEIWRPIKGFEYFMVSNLGRVKRLERRVYFCDGRKPQLLPERIIKKSDNKYYSTQQNEYDTQLKVGIMDDRRKHYLNVARVVYSAFVRQLNDVKDTQMLVLHRDGDTWNNRVENLCLVDPQEVTERNSQEGLSIITKVKEKLPNRSKKAGLPYRGKKVSQYSLNGDFIRSWPNAFEASRQFGLAPCNIYNVAKERQGHSGGYIWRYDTEAPKLDSHILVKYSNPIQMPINQYNSDGTYISSFRSAKQIARHCHFNKYQYQQLNKRLRAGNGTTEYMGYLWRYATL